MLQLKIPIGPEEWNDEKEEFIEPPYQILELEHSLVSLSKWESKYCKPFLSQKTDMTAEETLDYIKFMTLTENVASEVYDCITDDNVRDIRQYIEAPMTATTFSNRDNGRLNREVITAELVYYWMVSMNIPFECQHWHLNRLITLIRVCGVKSQSPKKMSKREIMRRNAALNAERRARLNSKG